ncbi:MAG: sodium-dependent transporter [Planctomycetales bacterium]|nr:sodium-dependent transporter [Planctomycetales bacterium]
MAERDIWGNRTAFVLASIGSAIGLGNLWRFPYVCYEFGGGAFLVAYIVCLVSAGIPLLMLEFALGKQTAQAAPGAFAKIDKRLEWFGWFAVGIGFVICSYYSAIMSYCVNYFYYSFTLAWGDDPAEFFNRHVLDKTGDPEQPWALGSFRWQLFFGLLLTWSLILACVWKGTKTVGKVVWVTVLGPWALLILFVIRGVTLEGAADGLSYYVTPRWSMLWNFSPAPGEIGAHELWLAAISQVFFSLTVGFGVMIAYGSFLDDETCIVKNTWIIGLGDALTAIVGGFAVFGALGHKAHADGVPITEVVESGPGLTFVTYPEIINGLPLPHLFGILFFVMLSLLAIDSAFSLVEALSSSVRDKFGFTHRQANVAVSLAGVIFGLPYMFGSGIHWLDIVDHFMNFCGLSIVVLGTCLIVGWHFPASRMRHFINQRSDGKIDIWWDIRIQLIVPAAILYMLGFEVYVRLENAYGDFGLRSQELVFGWGMLLLIFFASVVLSLARPNLRS